MTFARMRKAWTPAILALIAVGTQWIVTGSLDESELRTAIAGLVTAIAVYFVPNDPPSP